MKLISLAVSLAVAVCAHAGMVRVVAVEDGRTLTVESEGRRQSIRLAGIAVVDEVHAAELLRWTIGSSWILVETQKSGEQFVWRSPDALFVNRELVLRGYAQATMFGVAEPSNLNVTYLGEIDPPLPPITSRTGKDNGTSRRSKASRAPKTSTARKSAAGSPKRKARTPS